MKTCTLRKGKAIGAHRGFAETFNWLVRCFKNLTGGQGCKVQWVTDDTPMINVDTYDTVEDYNAETGGGGGDVTVTGTDESSHTGTEFKFVSATDSNIVVSVDSLGNMTIGAYYL